MASFVFTDVHGCIDELRELWSLANPSSDDLIVIAGDLLDRGPDSPAVVRFFRELAAQYQVVMIRGNHEDKHSRYRRNLADRPRVANDMAIRKPELGTITAGLSAEDIEFLDSALLYYRIPNTNITVLHGGVTPNMRRLPDNSSGWSKHDAQIMYVRQVAPDGNMIRLGDSRPGCRFWADIYDGRFGHIVFGHEPFAESAEPVKFPYATGLDLGCVFGGRLACVKITPDGNINPLTVMSRKKYASRLEMETE